MSKAYERGDIIVLSYGSDNNFVGVVLHVAEDYLTGKFWIGDSKRADSIEEHDLTGRKRPLIKIGTLSDLGIELPEDYWHEEWWVG